MSELALVRNSTKQTIIWTHIATSLGGAITISFIGLIYADGTFYIAAGIAFVLGLLAYRALVPFMYEHFVAAQNINSFDEYLSNGYRVPLSFVAFVNMFIFFLLALAQFVSVWLLLNIMDVPLKELAIVVPIATTILYLIYGVSGVFVTERIQLVVVFFWLISLVYFVLRNFEPTSVLALDNNYLLGLSRGPWVLFAVIVIFPFTALARADLWQRSMSCKSSEDARSAVSYLTIVMSCVYLLMGVVGLTLFAILPGIEDSNTAAFSVLNYLPAWLVAIALLGIFAALISSADSMLNLAAISGLNVLSAIRGNQHSDGTRTAHIGILGLFGLAIYFLVIYKIDLGSIVILASTASALLIPTLIVRVFSKRPYPYTSAISIAFGLVMSLATFALLRDPNIAFVPGAITAAITFFSLFRLENRMMNQIRSRKGQ